MLSDYHFCKEMPHEYNAFSSLFGTEAAEPMFFATKEILLGGNKIHSNETVYHSASSQETLHTVGNELFMLDIDLRSGLSGDHFRPDWDSIRLWLKGNASEICSNLYVSYLVMEYGLFVLSISLTTPAKITVYAFVKSLCLTHNEATVPQQNISVALTTNDRLFDLLEGVEFCDFESGQYYRAISVTTESTGTVVTLEKID